MRAPGDTIASKIFLPDWRQLLAKFDANLVVHDGFSSLAFIDRRRAAYTRHERDVPDTRRGAPVVQVWDIEQDRILKTITPFPSFRAVAASPVAIAVAHLADGEIRLYDLELEQRYALGSGVGPAMAFSPDGATFAAGSLHGVSLWSTQTGQKFHEWKFPGRVHALKFDSSGRYLVTGNANLLRLTSESSK